MDHAMPLTRTHLFQSSPVPKDGRYFTPPFKKYTIESFNPHPSRRTGATMLPIRLRLRVRCFNPHPSRRTGATVLLEKPLLPLTYGVFCANLEKNSYVPR